jgi:hypothetical protein
MRKKPERGRSENSAGVLTFLGQRGSVTNFKPLGELRKYRITV